MFKVGQYIVRKPDETGGLWGKLCKYKGLDPRKPFLVTGMFGSDPVIGAINQGSWWENMFELAPPPDKDLEGYL